jgi:hypothetical protein
MILDLSDEQTRTLLNLLIETIEADRYPRSPRIRLLREILGKCGEVGELSPELAARVRRYAPAASSPVADAGGARSRSAATPGPANPVSASLAAQE